MGYQNLLWGTPKRKVLLAYRQYIFVSKYKVWNGTDLMSAEIGNIMLKAMLHIYTFHISIYSFVKAV